MNKRNIVIHIVDGNVVSGISDSSEMVNMYVLTENTKKDHDDTIPIMLYRGTTSPINVTVKKVHAIPDKPLVNLIQSQIKQTDWIDQSKTLANKYRCFKCGEKLKFEGVVMCSVCNAEYDYKFNENNEVSFQLKNYGAI